MAATDATKYLNKTEYENALSQIRTYINTKVQPIDADLTAISALTGTSGLLKKTAANTWSLDTNTYLTTTSAASTYVTALGTSGNYLTWTKNGTTNNITVPYATKATQDGDGRIIRYNYVGYGDYLIPYGPNRGNVLNAQLNNAFYALDKRKTITSSGFKKFNAASLFDYNWNSLSTTVDAGGTGVITIGSASDPIFTTYTYGSLYIKFYVEASTNRGTPASVSVRAYGKKGSTYDWYNYSGPTYTKNSSGNDVTSMAVFSNGDVYNISAWEITIAAQENLTCEISEIVHIFNRTNGEVDQSVVTKYANAQTLYGAITIDNTFSTTGKATLNSLEVTDASTLKGGATIKRGATIQGTGNAITNINGGTATVDYAHIFVTGSNNTRPLVLQNGYGNVGIGVTQPSYKLAVGGTFNVTGASTLSSTLSVAEAITLSGTTDATRRIYFGDSSHYLELNSTGFHFYGAGVYSDS